MKRTLLVVSLASILVLAIALPAFAGPEGSSGTVYGRAVLAPYAIVVTGAGTDSGSPLTFEGQLGEFGYEKFGSQVTVQNIGTQATDLKLDVDQLPHSGSDTWNLSSFDGPDTAIWGFWSPRAGGSEVLPTSNPVYSAFGTLEHGLAAGDSDEFESYFEFPSSSSSTADHYMSAIISAVAPIN